MSTSCINGMSEQHKLIYPLKHCNDFLKEGIREDGRKIDKCRPIGIYNGSFVNCLESCAVKLGNSNIVCGIRANLAKPKYASPNYGYIMPNLDISFIAHHINIDQNYADVINCLLYNVLNNSDHINLESLSIHPKKLVWALYIDILCLEYDGSIMDAILLATTIALNNLILPKIIFDDSSGSLKVKPGLKKTIDVTNLLATYSLFDRFYLTDPTYNEECISNSLMHLGVRGAKVLLIYKRGKKSIVKEDIIDILTTTLQRQREILNIIKK